MLKNFLTPAETAVNLQQESNEILGIFTRTLTNLRNLNERVLARKAVHASKIEELQDEVTALEAQLVTNTAVMDKISTILS